MGTVSNGRWSKTWSQRVKIGRKVTSVGLGSYPVITLAEARASALENARAVAAGKDPRTEPFTLQDRQE